MSMSSLLRTSLSLGGTFQLSLWESEANRGTEFFDSFVLSLSDWRSKGANNRTNSSLLEKKERKKERGEKEREVNKQTGPSESEPKQQTTEDLYFWD